MFRLNTGLKACLLAVLLVAFFVLFFSPPLYSEQNVLKISPDLYTQLRYRYIGPEGNRVIAVIGEPGNPNVIYVGAASGGIWKSNDGGINWNPIFDDQNAQSVSSLAMAPLDPNIVWAGTGETFIRSNISIGDGIYKSTDAGKTWKNMGLKKTGRIGRILIDPSDSDIVFAAAMGHCYGPQKDRGVYRTIDGGKTWERVLFVDENTGASDIAMDPNNPRNIIAGMWPFKIRTWQRTSGGMQGGLFLSGDGGTTWKKLTGNRLPKPPTGKIGFAYAPSKLNCIYALIETPQDDFSGVLWRSENGGETWSLISIDQRYTQRSHYYTRMAVTPDDEDEVYFLANGFFKSLDGGKTLTILPRSSSPGGDNHDMWIDPLIPDRMLVANDGGVAISINRGKTWHKPKLPVAQMYHVAVDNQIPYFVYGNRQDGPSRRGPSNSKSRSITLSMWHSVGGGESGFTIPDPVDNNIIWSGNMHQIVTTYNLRTGHSRIVTVWPDYSLGWGPAKLKYRWNWTVPLVISPHDHNKVYVGSQFVHMTTNGGHSWEVISPDLTTNDKSRQVGSGGLTIDNCGVDFGCTLFAISESSLEEGQIWAGSNDGQVHVTRDGGKTWTNVSKNIPDVPEWGTVSNIESSRFNAGTCYISLDFHQMNNRNPYAFKTNDYGKSWKLITSGIPKNVFSYVHCIREDPEREGMLYLGTENTIYFTLNDGKNWMPLQNNLPHAPMHWLVIQEHFSDLVIGTYGRGFWIMDDITPLRQLNSNMIASDAYLFKLRPAYRFHNVSLPGDGGESSAATGQNPQYGASINYYLKKAPEEKVKITILDKTGKIVRTLIGTKNEGINRVYWDLRHKGQGPTIRLRTPPLDYPDAHLWPEIMHFNKNGWREISGLRFGGLGPIVVPGKFTVKLSVGTNEFTETLDVKKDPSTEGTIDNINEQNNLAFEIMDNCSTAAVMVNGLEWIRKQIDDLEAMAKNDKNFASILSDVLEFEKKANDLESKFFHIKHTHNLRVPGMLLRKLAYSGYGSVDFPPTEQQYEVHEMLSKQIADLQVEYNNLVNNDLLTLNSKLAENNLVKIVDPVGKY